MWFFLYQGLILKKINRGVSIKQSPYLKLYIDRCMAIRLAATNDLDKSMAKLLSNIIYGKLLEKKDHKDFNLVNDERKSKRLVCYF